MFTFWCKQSKCIETGRKFSARIVVTGGKFDRGVNNIGRKRSDDKVVNLPRVQMALLGLLGAWGRMIHKKL
jgi:hypothetical protein